VGVAGVSWAKDGTARVTAARAATEASSRRMGFFSWADFLRGWRGQSGLKVRENIILIVLVVSIS
jgi:hypothetical protein